MKEETLERLMIDRSLGALGEDVDELLAAYLTTRPEVRDPFSSVVRQARRVIGEDRTPIAVPPVPSLRIGHLLNQDRRKLWVNSIRMAACVLVGFALSALFYARSGNSAGPVQQVAQNAQPEPRPRDAGAAPVPPVRLTQGQVIRSARTAASESRPVRVVWQSPVKSPVLSEVR